MNKNIEKLNRRKNSENNSKLTKAYDKVERVIEALNSKEIPEENISVINSDIKMINSFVGTENELIKYLKKTYTKILTYLENELNLRQKFHFQNSWMVYGMIAGILFSVVFSNFMEPATWNSVPMCISMGLIFGLLAGRNRDKKAEKDGLQL